MKRTAHRVGSGASIMTWRSFAQLFLAVTVATTTICSSNADPLPHLGETVALRAPSSNTGVPLSYHSWHLEAGAGLYPRWSPKTSTNGGRYKFPVLALPNGSWQ